MKDELNIENFKQDYARLVIQYPNTALRTGITERLISRFYLPIRAECVDWVKKEHGLKLYQ